MPTPFCAPANGSRQMTVTMGNQLVECQECHNLYHQDCHKPQVTDKEVNDPRLIWHCARCTRQMKRLVSPSASPDCDGVQGRLSSGGRAVVL